MKYAVGRHPGATWRKSDFQIHTPRDPQWSGSPHLGGGTAELEAVRQTWANEFVQVCIKTGLGAIAVTDHHDLCFVPYIQKALSNITDETVRPWLFPGIEITCNDSSQCLVLFDVGISELTWNRLFGGHLQNIAIPESAAATNPQATMCGKDLSKFLDDIALDSPLYGKCIVLPHASSGGHKTIIRQGFHDRFRSLPFDGIYLDGPIESLDAIDRQKIYGEILQWGTRRRGIVPTGDNRSHAFDKLGKHGCWIRLGEPTAEAIRQAVLADEARIVYEQPVIPNQRLLSLRVQSTLTETFDLTFNDGFTALIGGRGSGKSAILEYLRFGLGRSANDISGHEDDVRAREKQLIAATLGDGIVTVELERDGVREVWSRNGSQRELITAQLPDGKVEQLTVLAAQQRFRGRAFYQKQLSSIATDRDKADEQITGIAAAETVDQRQQADKDIALAKRDVRSAVQRLVEFWILEAEHLQNVNSAMDLRRRIDAIKGKLEEGGLNPEHQQLLDEAPIYNTIGSLITESGTAIRRDSESIRALRNKLPSVELSDWGGVQDKADVMDFITVVANGKADIDSHLDQIAAILKSLSSSQQAFSTKFTEQKSHFDSLHSSAAQQQAHLQGLIEESKKLVRDLQTAEAAERNSASRVKLMEGAPSGLTEARRQLQIAVEARRGVLESSAIKVETMSGGSLKALVRAEEVPKQHLEALIGICDGHRIRELQDRCLARVSGAQLDASGVIWESLIQAAMDAYRHKLQTGATSLDGTEEIGISLQIALLGSLTVPQLASLYNGMSAENIVPLLIAVNESFVAFEYRDGKNYIPFSQASEGQQAAALLELLLRQDAGTLIIDQPEEDLDNRVIMRIAKLLQTTKQRRQLLFATHNPNFVVNGDADKVVVLHAGDTSAAFGVARPRVSIDVDGAIETPAVRLAITDTMEGGREAFELRGRKYQF
jgi:chromosome segregation protein